jgi:hypothetical protein
VECGLRTILITLLLPQHVLQDLPPHERRLCRMLSRSKSTTAAPVHAVTTEKLLEASLTTLETMGRHMHVAGTQSILMGNEHDGMCCAVLGADALCFRNIC